MTAKSCNPPCASSRCYGCNAAARDLAVKVKRAGGTMRDLPDWAAWRVRQMAANTAAAQSLSQAYSDARERGAAARSYSDQMRHSDTQWVCASCGNEQDASIERYVANRRRYCPTCAAPMKAADVDRLKAAAEAEAVLKAIQAGNPLESIFAKGKAAWTTEERVALVSAKMVCVHCGKRINVPGVPGAGELRKHCGECYMAREYGERAAAAAAAKSAAGIANVGAVLSGVSAGQAARRAEDDAPRKDRFELIELEDAPDAPAAKPEEPTNPDDRFMKIELD
jgi:hypothetical protein